MPSRVELLWWDGCPSWPRALEDLRDAMRAAGLSPEDIEMTEVQTDQQAQELGFIGSPTIRVDGVDLFPTGDNTPGLNCRIYRLRDGRVSPLPDPADLRAALARATTAKGAT
jgi:hypothetical protein